MHPILFHLPFGVPIYGYGAMLCLAVVFGRLLALHLAGQAFATFVAGYAIVRCVIEVARADPDRGTVGPLSTSQFIALATLLSAVALFYATRRGRDRLLAPEPGPKGKRRR